MIYTEPGGGWRPSSRWVTDNDSRLPIVAFMAGRFMDEMRGMSFGHAGAGTVRVIKLYDGGAPLGA